MWSTLYLLFYKRTNHIVSQITADDTDMSSFYFFMPETKVKTQISMRLYDGRIININETVRNLGNECKLSTHPSSYWV